MPMEIEQKIVGQSPPLQVRWPRHMGLEAVATNPQKTTEGVRVSVRAESNHRVSSEEFFLALSPVLKELGLEVVGKPKLIVDDSPVWVWRKMLPDKPEQTYFQAVVASGPLKGHEGMAMAPSDCTQKYDPETGEEISWKCVVGMPTVKDTAVLPKFVEDWSVMARPADLELPESKIRQLKLALREVRAQLRGLVGAGCMVGTQVAAVEVPAPQPPAPKAVKVAVGSAAIIGVALAMLTWGRKV